MTTLSRLALAANARIGPHYGALVRGVSAYGAAELAIRVVRLGTTVVIARRLAPAIVGEAALALTIFEIMRVLERTGTGQRIVRAQDDELGATCNAVQRFYWAWSTTLMLAQLVMAAALTFWLARPVAGAMLAALALVYPCMAGGHVQFFLAIRAQRSTRLARINATQNIADQLLTTVMLLAWPSPWSLVLPKLLTAPLWVVMARRVFVWQPDSAAGFIPIKQLLRFSTSILAAEAMATLRTQGDNLIIAATMGTTALGTYYFAFNAGLGIVSSLVGAFGTVAFPLLSATPRGSQRIAALRRIVLAGAVVFVPLVALQSLAAPLYVPAVFGHRWAFAAPLIATLCLAGVPLLVSSLTTSWLRAEGRVGVDAISSTLGCVAALGGLYLGTRTGHLAIAAAGLVAGQALAAGYTATRILIPTLISRNANRTAQEQPA